MAHFVNVAALQFSSTLRYRHPVVVNNPENRAVVLDELDRRLDELRGLEIDLLVTCEEISGFGQTLEQAESLTAPGPFLRRYADFARGERAHVAGAAKICDAGHVYNSTVLFGPDGHSLGRYDKMFLTASELQAGVCPGRGATVLATAVGRLGFAVCFDLNFTSLLDEYVPLAPDILVFSSMFHGAFLQQWWAYRCRAFFVGSLATNDAGICDPLGQSVARSHKHYQTAMARINLDRMVMHLNRNQARFPDILRRYGRDVEIVIPAHLGAAILYSHGAERSVAEIAREFGLEDLDSYFRDAVRDNAAARR